MSLPADRRAPKRNGGFSWGRVPAAGGSIVTWRLFRRDHRRALHMREVTFSAGDTRAHIARQLRRACHQLRDHVDEIDLAAMGVNA